MVSPQEISNPYTDIASVPAPKKKTGTGEEELSNVGALEITKEAADNLLEGAKREGDAEAAFMETQKAMDIADKHARLSMDPDSLQLGGNIIQTSGRLTAGQATKDAGELVEFFMREKDRIKDSSTGMAARLFGVGGDIIQTIGAFTGNPFLAMAGAKITDTGNKTMSELLRPVQKAEDELFESFWDQKGGEGQDLASQRKVSDAKAQLMSIAENQGRVPTEEEFLAITANLPPDDVAVLREQYKAKVFAPPKDIRKTAEEGAYGILKKKSEFDLGQVAKQFRTEGTGEVNDEIEADLKRGDIQSAQNNITGLLSTSQPEGTIPPEALKKAQEDFINLPVVYDDEGNMSENKPIKYTQHQARYTTVSVGGDPNLERKPFEYHTGTANMLRAIGTSVDDAIDLDNVTDNEKAILPQLPDTDEPIPGYAVLNGLVENIREALFVNKAEGGFWIKTPVRPTMAPHEYDPARVSAGRFVKVFKKTWSSGGRPSKDTLKRLFDKAMDNPNEWRDPTVTDPQFWKTIRSLFDEARANRVRLGL